MVLLKRQSETSASSVRVLKPPSILLQTNLATLRKRNINLHFPPASHSKHQHTSPNLRGSNTRLQRVLCPTAIQRNLTQPLGRRVRSISFPYKLGYSRGICEQFRGEFDGSEAGDEGVGHCQTGSVGVGYGDVAGAVDVAEEGAEGADGAGSGDEDLERERLRLEEVGIG
jgi:hypothetical protein